MSSERGQATVEWTGLVLLVALVLVAAGHLAPTARGTGLGSSLAHAVTHAARTSQGAARAHAPAARPRPAPRSRPPALPPFRRASALARKAWFGCLVYERIRYTQRHPESGTPGYTFPYGVALRIAKRCLSPLDLLHDLSALNPLG